ncbi:MAG: hypothetical protein BWX80_01252 [Candidatus Hydrogenedentes bacterium ADurb.Bin101]|jgi:hypothetical protein|nr:MAG: hypothetical protein BWX80_01252 [Candidatus Hydrogenedentes bacterium ADurb.Bin101]HOC67662.1 hypothetical protein [Candidatus Hydrogenedentota bacterium]
MPLLLPARIDAAAAARLFWRPRFGNLYGLWRARPVKRAPDGLPASLELVWMPAYAFRLALVKGQTRSSTWVSVDASFGGFALFERAGVLEEGTLHEDRLPPVFDQAGAETLARQGLLRYVLRKRGVKPVIEATEAVSVYYAPVWVYYYYSIGRKIDLKVLDGYTGSPMGGQMRAAIVNAFIQRRQGHAQPS